MSAVPAGARRRSGSGARDLAPARRLQARIPLLQLVALVAVFAYGAIDLGFWNWSSVKQILVLASLAGLASAGQTLLILMGGFDLSISGFIVAERARRDRAQGQVGRPLRRGDPDRRRRRPPFSAALAGQICHRFRSSR